MGKLSLRVSVGLGLALSSVTLSWAQESARSYPPDTTPYSRPAIGADTADPVRGVESTAGSSSNLIGVIDTVVNNTDASLQTTDTFNDGETSIAVNPLNRREIVISAFSGSWGANAPIWHSTNGGQTWTKRFTVPVPPGAGSGCPCDQTFDFGRNDVLFGTFLHTNLFTGSTTNPASSASWSWWIVGGNAQVTNLASTSPDQPWLLHNRGTGSGTNENVYVAYDDFTVSPVGMRVVASINQVPPQFAAGSDKFVGSASGAINPGHRLANDRRNGWMYSLFQNCIVNCATLAANPKTIEYKLNRSTDNGATWTLNSSSTGIVVATADSTQPQPKFGTVNALLGGVLHAAVDPATGDLYYVYGNRDAAGNNGLAIRRVFDNGSGGVTIGPENFVVNGTVQAALPSVAVADQGMVGVFYYTFNGIVAGFPQFSTFLAVSTDQGATFNTQLLATFLSPANDNGDGRQRVFGDYVQMKAVGSCFYGSFTGNGAAFGRSTANNDPIFFQACAAAPPPPPAVCGGKAKLGDFNGDGCADLLFRRTNGQVLEYLMIGGVLQSAPLVGQLGSDWQNVGVGDFNGDGKADILFRRTDGTLLMFLMNGGQVIAAPIVGVLGPDWRNVGVGDFNGDGKADILFRRADGTLLMLLMNGSQVLSATIVGQLGADWQNAVIGDFDGDGKADILFRRTNGQVLVLLMSGPQVLSAPIVGVLGSDWQNAGVVDLDGDGNADIVF